MLIKPIVKRGVKETSWLDGFVKSRLNGNATHEAICTEKMEYALSKYCRKLDYHTSSKFSIDTGLFFNNGIYSIAVISRGYKKVLLITDIEKQITANIERRIRDFSITEKKASKEEKNAYAEYFKLDENANLNPFYMINFTEHVSKSIFNEKQNFKDIVEEFEFC
jgi:hypothetical protein